MIASLSGALRQGPQTNLHGHVANCRNNNILIERSPRAIGGNKSHKIIRERKSVQVNAYAASAAASFDSDSNDAQALRSTSEYDGGCRLILRSVIYKKNFHVTDRLLLNVIGDFCSKFDEDCCNCESTVLLHNNICIRCSSIYNHAGSVSLCIAFR